MQCNVILIFEDDDFSEHSSDSVSGFGCRQMNIGSIRLDYRLDVDSSRLSFSHPMRIYLPLWQMAWTWTW